MSDDQPTIPDYIEAAEATYLRTPPPGWAPLMEDGAADEMSDPTHGFFAEAFVDPSGQVIIAYEGTELNAFNPSGPIYALESVATDTALFLAQQPQALTDAKTFAVQAALDASSQGYSSNQIFLTGHSLGGAEAEAAAVATGLGGDTFGAPGITITGSSANANLIDFIDYGDPVGNFATDTAAGSYYAPPGVAHVGQVEMVGSPSSATALTTEAEIYSALLSLRANPLWSNTIASGLPLADLIAGAALVTDMAVALGTNIPQHLLGNYASDLNYTLLSDGTVIQNGSVGPIITPSTNGFIDQITGDVPFASYSDTVSSSDQVTQVTATTTNGFTDTVNLGASAGSDQAIEDGYNASNQLTDIIQVNADDSQIDTFYNLSGGFIEDEVFSFDSNGDMTSTTVAFTNGNSITFDAGTYDAGAGLSYDAASNTLSATLMANGIDFATVNVNATGAGILTLYPGPLGDITPTEMFNFSAAGNIDVTAPSAGTSTLQSLANYLTELGDPLTAAELDQADENFLSPATPPTVVTQGTVNGSTDTFYDPPNNATITGPTSATVDGVVVPITTNILRDTGGSITEDTLTNIQELDVDNEVNFSPAVIISGNQFNYFQQITASLGSGVLIIADSGTFSELGKNFGPDILLIAGSWQGTTLIGETLGASTYGNDTLIASGPGALLNAGMGVDILESSSEGDTQFNAEYGLAAGSVIEGFGGDNRLFVSGNIAGATITGVQALYWGPSLTLTAAQLNEFSQIFPQTGDSLVAATSGVLQSCWQGALLQ